MHSGYRVDSMTEPLRRVLMWRPCAILDADPAMWNYRDPVKAPQMLAQYERFVHLVEASGACIEWIEPDPLDGLADSIFTYDPTFVLPAGAVVLRPGKVKRRAPKPPGMSASTSRPAYRCSAASSRRGRSRAATVSSSTLEPWRSDSDFARIAMESHSSQHFSARWESRSSRSTCPITVDPTRACICSRS